eukprot:TRINITY_DN3793_c0_g2_i4.p1 TRINITY_DN3793_c0_g2~~TRINITY_DN3793_c0_g2_i4.p1  ORF type:complete len:750 (+),score=226.62 TRINITY_DN3793_c0_g2_i4:77-2326(+)
MCIRDRFFAEPTASILALEELVEDVAYNSAPVRTPHEFKAEDIISPKLVTRESVETLDKVSLQIIMQLAKHLSSNTIEAHDPLNKLIESKEEKHIEAEELFAMLRSAALLPYPIRSAETHANLADFLCHGEGESKVSIRKLRATLELFATDAELRAKAEQFFAGLVKNGPSEAVPEVSEEVSENKSNIRSNSMKLHRSHADSLKRDLADNLEYEEFSDEENKKDGSAKAEEAKNSKENDSEIPKEISKIEAKSDRDMKTDSEKEYAELNDAKDEKSIGGDIEDSKKKESSDDIRVERARRPLSDKASYSPKELDEEIAPLNQKITTEQNEKQPSADHLDSEKASSKKDSRKNSVRESSKAKKGNVDAIDSIEDRPKDSEERAKSEVQALSEEQKSKDADNKGNQHEQEEFEEIEEKARRPRAQSNPVENREGGEEGEEHVEDEMPQEDKPIAQEETRIRNVPIEETYNGPQQEPTQKENNEIVGQEDREQSDGSKSDEEMNDILGEKLGEKVSSAEDKKEEPVDTVQREASGRQRESMERESDANSPNSELDIGASEKMADEIEWEMNITEKNSERLNAAEKAADLPKDNGEGLIDNTQKIAAGEEENGDYNEEFDVFEEKSVKNTNRLQKENSRSSAGKEEVKGSSESDKKENKSDSVEDDKEKISKKEKGSNEEESSKKNSVNESIHLLDTEKEDKEQLVQKEDSIHGVSERSIGEQDVADANSGVNEPEEIVDSEVMEDEEDEIDI